MIHPGLQDVAETVLNRSGSSRQTVQPSEEDAGVRAEPKSPYLSEDEQLRQFLRPPDMDVPDWGIPSAVDPAQCSETLKVIYTFS